MKKWLGILIILILLGVGGFFALNQYIYNEKQADPTDVVTETPDMNSTQPALVTPIAHASMILHLGGQVIYNDPVGVDLFADQPEPNLVFISDIHGDHFDAETLAAVITDQTTIIVPQAVTDLLPENLPGTIVVMQNGEKGTQKGIQIEAIPMYNLPETADARHTKGRGNGYVISAERLRVYIAGDTSVTPEMRALRDIDVAFVPMNLPFTMSVEEAAEGVLAFKPKTVHPYHYRGQDGLADVEKFSELVTAGNPEITVQLLDFYPAE